MLIPWLGGAENDEGLAMFGRPKASILKQGTDGMTVADVCRKAGISQATHFNWKKIYGPPPVRKRISSVEPRARISTIAPRLCRRRSALD